MHSTVVILVVGLTPALIGAHTPNLRRLAEQGGLRGLRAVTPAVTCTVQSTLVTGLPPSGHGAVANGWYFRDLAEVWLWRQSNRLIAGEKIWEAGRRRDPDFTCAKMFWWYNMYASADWSATPRPMYPADGRKIPDHYAHPPDLHDELDARLGPFPLFKFWGPAADITSSQWIARATMHVRATRRPTLTLCYLPHLDYNLQRLGPDLAHPAPASRTSRRSTRLAGELIEQAERDGARIIVVSEYGITPVRDAVHINRALREAGLVQVRVEMGRELLDAGASRAFALADHQVAHVYVQHGASVGEVKALLEGRRRGRAGPGRGGQARLRPRPSRARASWWRSPGRIAGSATTTGWTTPARRTSPAPSTSTASPATTRSSCSSTRRSASRRSRSAGGS